VDIISSSLNGFSLRVFSGSGPPELDIFMHRLVQFKRVADSAVFQNLLKQDLFLVNVIKEIFDRFQFIGRHKTWMCK